jgi:hypothetical protein
MVSTPQTPHGQRAQSININPRELRGVALRRNRRRTHRRVILTGGGNARRNLMADLNAAEEDTAVVDGERRNLLAELQIVEAEMNRLIILVLLDIIG